MIWVGWETNASNSCIIIGIGWFPTFHLRSKRSTQSTIELALQRSKASSIVHRHLMTICIKDSIKFHTTFDYSNFTNTTCTLHQYVSSFISTAFTELQSLYTDSLDVGLNQFSLSSLLTPISNMSQNEYWNRAGILDNHNCLLPIADKYRHAEIPEQHSGSHVYWKKTTTYRGVSTFSSKAEYCSAQFYKYQTDVSLLLLLNKKNHVRI